MAGPFNFEAELGQLKRKQELADALQKGALSGELPTGGGLGGLLTAVMRPFQQRRLQREVTSGMADLQGRYKQELGKKLEDYIRLRSPSEKTQWTGQELSAAGADVGVPQLTPEMLPGKPRQAAAQAMASQFPQLQAIGKSDMEQLAKGTLTAKDLLSLPNMDPKSALVAAMLKSQGVEDTDARGRKGQSVSDEPVPAGVRRGLDDRRTRQKGLSFGRDRDHDLESRFEQL